MHPPCGIVPRRLRYRSKRIDAHRWSSPVFLKPKQNRFQIRSVRPIISLCLTRSHCLTLFVARSGFDACRINRREKRHGKGTMKAGDGFASVAYDSHRKQLVPRLTNRKDVGFPWKRSSKLTSKRSCTTDKRATAPVRIDLRKPQLRLKIPQGQ